MSPVLTDICFSNSGLERHPGLVSSSPRSSLPGPFEAAYSKQPACCLLRPKMVSVEGLGHEAGQAKWKAKVAVARKLAVILLAMASPHFEIRPDQSISSTHGVASSTQYKRRHFSNRLKRAGSSIVALKQSAVSGPTPGTVMYLRICASCRAGFRTLRSRSSICFSMTSRALSNDATTSSVGSIEAGKLSPGNFRVLQSTLTGLNTLPAIQLLRPKLTDHPMSMITAFTLVVPLSSPIVSVTGTGF